MPACGRSIATQQNNSGHLEFKMSSEQSKVWNVATVVMFVVLCSQSLWAARINLAVARLVSASTRFEVCLALFSEYLVDSEFSSSHYCII
jgi:hypothetical protein